MMNAPHIKSSYAIVKGFQLCLTDREIRKLLLWPWLVGFVSYLCAAFAAIYCYSSLLNWMMGDATGFWSSIFHFLVAILLAISLLIATMIVTFTLVLVLTSVFQSAIATVVLKRYGIPVAASSSVIKETGRTIAVESVKLLWLLPLMAISFLLFFIPILLPIALVMGSWLLAYQFVDVVLDTMRVRSMARIRFGMRYGFTLVLFGATLMLICTIPFVGFLIPPIAVAGAAWLLSEEKLLEQFSAET